MQISKYFCISITSISIRHVICTHNAPDCMEAGARGYSVKGQSFASFPRWRNWLHLLSVLSVLCQRILHLSSTDADDDPICLSNDATCCATVRPTCNMQRATCNDLKSLLEAFNACCCNCNRFSASLLPTNSLASFAWFSVCNEMRNLLPVCSCLFAVPLAHLPLSTSFCLPLSSFFPHHRSSYCRLHCNCNCRTQHSVPRSQFNILSLFSFVSARSRSLSLCFCLSLWHQRNWFVSLAICRLLAVQIDWNWV